MIDRKVLEKLSDVLDILCIVSYDNRLIERIKMERESFNIIEIEEILQVIRDVFKREFLENVFMCGNEFDIKDIREYIEEVEEYSSWEIDYEVESFRNYLSNER